MNVATIIGIIFVIAMLVLSFTPAYRKYKMLYIEKVGYWDILIQFLVIAGINLYMYLNYGAGALFLLVVPIPLDIIFLATMISSYLRVRKYKQEH
ncbi:hypothetical protein [Lactobacillus ultunensis]|uniref:Uncharacterized protein n=1 Tax=Lactobacillus ultunensis DSM 16047 TaxID=525365 RepID=C2EP75_9LACO|nr:hypothetical protein [Lactobacillus ultunensis]EEJ71673.1 hypothetical protein HMPREF0548_1471 [Lactobacillus ultunensis DSM 16047]QQP28442.1 hypothetical protein H4B44_10185 [Lactobacillus ultunensis]